MVLKIVCLFLAAICMAVMDKLQFHSLGKGDKFWDTSQSWLNKYKNFPIDNRPRFFGSKTFFVFLTDGWHFMKFLFLTFITIPFVPMGLNTIEWLAYFLGFRVVFGLTFTLFFHLILGKKNIKK